MKDGFVKIASVTNDLKVADTEFNSDRIIECIKEAESKGAKVIVFPELSVTGYTCGDLFLQESLIKGAALGVKKIAEASTGDALVFVGFPFEYGNKLYNTAAVIHRGKVLAIIPKRYLPNYSEFYELRHFTPGFAKPVTADFLGEKLPFGSDILFTNTTEPAGLTIGAEICEDCWVPCPPSVSHALNGAELIVNLSASDELVAKEEFRRLMISALSARLVSGYVYASAGEGESTQDLVFGGDNMIAENGKIVSEAALFKNGILYGEIDVQRIRAERKRMNTFEGSHGEEHLIIPVSFDVIETEISFVPERFPFVPSDGAKRDKHCDEVFMIQSRGLRKRLSHINAKTAVIGISGGLDSTLALLVTVRAFDDLGLDRKGIKCITMPCFGTTDRTYNNAVTLIKSLNCDFREIDIKDSILKHFEDIGQDKDNHDVTYENAQARERTQILMDVANMTGGLVIGTGDLSELAMGWATYNGDHMSMYAVNAGVPKTLVRHLVRFYADKSNDKALKESLLDILDTPVSPELLPPKDGKISQETEDLVGPYELHDYFLYYMLRYGFPPKKILRLANLSFKGVYDEETVLKWMKTFYRRFFSQQFKRSCLPDGPKVGTVAVSPRGDLRMPSDAVAAIWLKELENV